MISLMMAVALLAADGPSATPPAAADKPKDPNEMVCKREAVVGSKMKQRVCMTAAQWEERRADDKALVNSAQRGGNLNNPN